MITWYIVAAVVLFYIVLINVDCSEAKAKLYQSRLLEHQAKVSEEFHITIQGIYAKNDYVDYTGNPLVKLKSMIGSHEGIIYALGEDNSIYCTKKVVDFRCNCQREEK